MAYVKTSNYREGTVPQCYAVLAKCGHTHKAGDNFIPILFGVVGKVGEGEAEKVAAGIREMDRVKHDQEDAILFVVPVDYATYKRIRIINDFDPYMNVQNKQDQLAYQDLIEPRVVAEPDRIVYTRHDKVRGQRGNHGKARYRDEDEFFMRDMSASQSEDFEDDSLILQRYAAGIRDNTIRYSKNLATDVVRTYVDVHMERLLNSEHALDVQDRLNNFECYHKGIRSEKYQGNAQ